jgi:serine/threonine protein kinase
MESTADESEPAVERASEAQPMQIGRYRILERRGAGGMGTVYKAHDPELDRIVALKLPRFDGREHDLGARRQRFQREARAAAQVWHPHVCPIFDVGEHEGQPFVVMAYLEGQSLAEWLANQSRFDDLGHAVILVRQVLDALDAIHARGIIHRDLKPGNIVLDAAGRAIVTDFGLARPEQDAEHLTADGLVVGTPAYMAPEQAAGQAERIGPWTDLYSIGVVFYQMLTGRLPFEGPGLTIFAEIVNETPAAPSALRSELADLDRIVLKALAKSEKDRYQHARQFDADLVEWCRKNSPAEVSLAATSVFRSMPPTPPSKTAVGDTLSPRAGSKRVRWLLAGAAVIILAACFGVAQLPPFRGLWGNPEPPISQQKGIEAATKPEPKTKTEGKKRGWKKFVAVKQGVSLIVTGPEVGVPGQVLRFDLAVINRTGDLSVEVDWDEKEKGQKPETVPFPLQRATHAYKEVGTHTIRFRLKNFNDLVEWPVKIVAPHLTEENLNVRLEAALKIQNVADKEAALAGVARDAASVGLAELVTEAITALGPLKDTVAIDCAAEFAKVGKRQAALEIAQMIGDSAKRDATLKKLAAE